MPMARDMFDRGIDPAEARMVEFLDSNPNQAYTLEELLAGARLDMGDPFSRLTALVLLWGLNSRGAVVSKLLGGETYYASAKPGVG